MMLYSNKTKFPTLPSSQPGRVSSEWVSPSMSVPQEMASSWNLPPGAGLEGTEERPLEDTCAGLSDIVFSENSH